MARKRPALLVALLLGGCNWYYNTLPSPDDLVEAIPWFDHMIKSRAVSPYARADLPRYTVPGTVPITGSEGDWSAEFLSGNPATADRLVNPTTPDSTLASGDTLYHTFCAVCHGNSGTVTDATVGPRVGAKSLLTPTAIAFSDGYLYSIIRYGRGLMPRYGDKVYRHEDRWAIVNYVRKLQHETAAAAQAMPSVLPSFRPSVP
ncbi:MAG TPA: cytochrome c [Gemmatimonadales bacterium]|jgi:mono/diheme cytochrome c family protein|nr:cytochrome c [Gemmatimonadales bacterium]